MTHLSIQGKESESLVFRCNRINCSSNVSCVSSLTSSYCHPFASSFSFALSLLSWLRRLQ